MTDETPNEWDDPIVAEVRRVREQLAQQFNNDLAAICADAQRRTEDAQRAGHPVKSPASRKSKGAEPRTMRAG